MKEIITRKKAGLSHIQPSKLHLRRIYCCLFHSSVSDKRSSGLKVQKRFIFCNVYGSHKTPSLLTFLHEIKKYIYVEIYLRLLIEKTSACQSTAQTRYSYHLHSFGYSTPLSMHYRSALSLFQVNWRKVKFP